MDFAFKPFEAMTPADYAQIGLRCGLEVHQQLRTATKLFCRCPAGRYSREYDAEILRHMRPTLSELGEYDGTALMEKKTRKNIYYRIHHDTVCTYEFDDTPPFLIDDQALDIALKLSLLFNLNLVSELHIARKQYLDGSIPTGFQRTGIIGVTGWLPYGAQRIGVRQLSIEEDACREVSDVGHDRVYLTDRLGMPLVEVVTEPDMQTPDAAAGVCQLIRRVCRSTGKVRTGYGAARQDVNVSVRGGTRVEIKGVPQIWRIPRLVYNEARRQWTLLQIREELKQRGVTAESLVCGIHDVTRALAKTQWDPVRTAVAAGQRVKCVVLKGFAGILSVVTQEHTALAKEFSDRVRVIACLTRLPNITHSDTATETLSARDWSTLRRKTQAQHEDALVLVWGGADDTETACNEIVIRAREATVGVPSDTRQPLKDGTTGFERVLPGAERMYPDTDLPPQAIPPARVARIRAGLPRNVWDREGWYRELRVPADTVLDLLSPTRAAVFDRLVNELKIAPTLAAVILVQRFKAWRRARLAPERLSADELVGAFAAYAAGRLAREGIVEVLEAALRAGSDVSALAERLRPASEAEVRQHLALLLRTREPARFATPVKRYRALMGDMMRAFVGRFEGGALARIVAEELGVSTPAAATARQSAVAAATPRS